MSWGHKESAGLGPANMRRLYAWLDRCEARGIKTDATAHCMQLVRGVDWTHRQPTQSCWIDSGRIQLGNDEFLPRVANVLNKGQADDR